MSTTFLAFLPLSTRRRLLNTFWSTSCDVNCWGCNLISYCSIPQSYCIIKQCLASISHASCGWSIDLFNPWNRIICTFTGKIQPWQNLMILRYHLLLMKISIIFLNVAVATGIRKKRLLIDFRLWVVYKFGLNSPHFSFWFSFSLWKSTCAEIRFFL